MFINSQDQIVPLDYLRLEVGHTVTLTVSNAPSNFTLEFLHGNDRTTWRADPEISGTVGSGVFKGRFTVVSTKMRLNFLSAPGSDVQITATPDAVPTF